ncbi:Cytochrome P450 71B21 [Raphanus sativus]|nr:Cytochrome P450 71B21 [Raphanus sativus]
MDKVEELVLESETNVGTFAFTDFFPGGLGWVIDRISRQHNCTKPLPDLPEQSDDHSDILSVMLDLINKQSKAGSFKVAHDHLEVMSMRCVLAGVNTGAFTMILAMTELTRHPKVIKKLQQEIRGYYICWTGVEINTYAIGRYPNCWTNPNEFIPKTTRISIVNCCHSLEVVGCPGMATGMTIVKLGLLNVLYFFDWSLPDGMTIKDIEMEEAGAFVIAKKVPLELVPVLNY